MAGRAEVLNLVKFFDSRVWKWTRRCLVGLGLLFIINGIIFAYTAMTGDIKYSFTSRQTISGQLFKAGIEDMRGDSIKFGSIKTHPFFGEYTMMFCVDLKSFSIRESAKRHWKNYNDEDIRKGLGSFLELYDVTHKCFGGSTNIDNWTATVIDTRQHQDGRITGYDLLIHDPATQRLAFYGFEY
ncbi:MAG: hypothetical protein ACSHX3_04780 [Litorimonas sp.]